MNLQLWYRLHFTKPESNPVNMAFSTRHASALAIDAI